MITPIQLEKQTIIIEGSEFKEVAVKDKTDLLVGYVGELINDIPYMANVFKDKPIAVIATEKTQMPHAHKVKTIEWDGVIVSVSAAMIGEDSFNTDPLFEGMLIHELVHAIQLAEGRLVFAIDHDNMVGSSMFWCGEEYSYDEIVTKYPMVPWEIEAYELADVFLHMRKPNAHIYQCGVVSHDKLIEITNLEMALNQANSLIVADECNRNVISKLRWFIKNEITDVESAELFAETKRSELVDKMKYLHSETVGKEVKEHISKMLPVVYEKYGFDFKGGI